jgi:curli biogenesis system outer membrane secretion channel CsgG
MRPDFLRSLLLAPVLLLAACQSQTSEKAPKAPFLGPVPVTTRTPVDAALECLSRSPEVQRYPRIFAVHVISDQTGRYSSEEVGNYLPRDSAGMMVSLLQKAGVKQVNRSNTAVSEWEIARAREQILGDGGNVVIGGESLPFRPLVKGALRGSDYVIDGVITQLDFNSYSGGLEASVGGAGGGVRNFALTAAVDIRVTDTKSTQIIKARSYSKQAVGREVFASVFRFFSDELFDIKIGGKSQEGLQAAIRWVLADAAYDLVKEITGHDGACDAFLPKASQEDRRPVVSAAAAAPAAPAPAALAPAPAVPQAYQPRPLPAGSAPQVERMSSLPGVDL